jgi:hypothetical protein
MDSAAAEVATHDSPLSRDGRAGWAEQ